MGNEALRYSPHPCRGCCPSWRDSKEAQDQRTVDQNRKRYLCQKCENLPEEMQALAWSTPQQRGVCGVQLKPNNKKFPYKMRRRCILLKTIRKVIEKKGWFTGTPWAMKNILQPRKVTPNLKNFL